MKKLFKVSCSLMLTIILFSSCSSSKTDDTWKGYELGGGIPPSSWYININGNTVNAIHSTMGGGQGNYKGTINEISVEGDITKYKVSLDLGSGMGSINYTMELAGNKDKYFGLADNSSSAKFEAVMKPDDGNGGNIYCERKK